MTNIALLLIKFHFIYHNIIYIHCQRSCIYAFIADTGIITKILVHMKCYFLKTT